MGPNYLGQAYLGQYYGAGIQLDETSNSGFQVASGSYSWMHTVGNGANQGLFVSVSLLSAANSVTALTYNGVALTKVRSDVSVSTTVRTEIWYLAAPPQGAHAIAITLNAVNVSGAIATSLNNVDQVTTIDAQNGGTAVTGAGGGSSSISTTSLTNGVWAIDAIATADNSINAANPPQNETGNITGTAGTAGQSIQVTNAISGSSVTEVWNNIAALTTWTGSMILVRPAGVNNGSPSASLSPSSSVSSSVSPSSSSSSSRSPSASVSPSSSSSSSLSPSASLSPSSSSSSSISPSASRSPSASLSPSSSSSASLSPSASRSPSSSISPSISPSASLSPSSSISSSLSPSASKSPSASISPSNSSSGSQSPSSSMSPSSSGSPSLSPSSSSSSSISSSTSPSASVSPSSSTSSSVSPSASISPSSSYSPSSSISASPSLGYEDYSRQGIQDFLPSNNDDLVTMYTTAEMAIVSQIDGVFVVQTGTDVYMIHQFKNFIGESTQVQLNWKGKSTETCSVSPITLQIFNQQSQLWQTVDQDGSAVAGADVTLTATILDTSFYIDPDQVITCRVFQEAL